MINKFVKNLFAYSLIFLLMSPVCISINDDSQNEVYQSKFSNDYIFDNSKFKAIYQENISFDIKIKIEDGFWQDDNITAFNGSIVDFNIDLETTRGYQILSAIITLPNTENGLLFEINNNSVVSSKNPTILDIGKQDIIFVWMPVLFSADISISFSAKIQNLGVDKQIIGAGVGFIDYETFDMINDSANISSIPSPIPFKPETPYGPESGEPNIMYNYTTKTFDPDGDQIYYMWDWGDHSTSDWEGPYESGENITSSHIWDSTGNYYIRVKAKDESGYESDWSDYLVVSMPRNIKKNPQANIWFIKGIFKFSFEDEDYI